MFLCFNSLGFLLKDEVSLCGYRAYKTQLEDVLVILDGTMVTEEPLKGNDVSMITELQTAIGHTIFMRQVAITST